MPNKAGSISSHSMPNKAGFLQHGVEEKTIRNEPEETMKLLQSTDEYPTELDDFMDGRPIDDLLILALGADPSTCYDTLDNFISHVNDVQTLRQIFNLYLLCTFTTRKNAEEFCAKKNNPTLQWLLTKCYVINNSINFTFLSLTGHCLLAAIPPNQGSKMVKVIRRKFGATHIWALNPSDGRLSTVQRKILTERASRISLGDAVKYGRLILIKFRERIKTVRNVKVEKDPSTKHAGSTKEDLRYELLKTNGPNSLYILDEYWAYKSIVPAGQAIPSFRECHSARESAMRLDKEIAYEIPDPSSAIIIDPKFSEAPPDPRD